MIENRWLEQLQQSPTTNGLQAIQYLWLDHAEQLQMAHDFKCYGAVLITEWVACDAVQAQTVWYVLYWLPNGRKVCAQTLLQPKRLFLADLSAYFPVATRQQRAIYDLTKVPTQHVKDKRPWLSHGHFPIGVLNPNVKAIRHQPQHYHFVKVSGAGVHEIPVGPVHAGIIEPGHFRFSVVGERILKLEQRLGYTHKGIHSLLIGKDITQGAKVLGRISGDTTVAYAYAYALACEQLLSNSVSAETQIVRAILLERERLINHIADIGAIVNDTAFASLQAQFAIIKEQVVRENAALVGHRYMMDAIIPGQALPLWESSVVARVLQTLTTLSQQLSELQMICDQHHGLQERLTTTGILSQAHAKKLAVLGLAAKASAVAIDSRAMSAGYPYNKLDFTTITQPQGDVAARVNLRFAECQQSITLIKQLLERDFSTEFSQAATSNEEKTVAVAMVEGWRGPVTVALKLQGDKLQWCHFHDPSWQNWLALEYAVLGNIVADFPLINKSFNLSYSGQDC